MLVAIIKESTLQATKNLFIERIIIRLIFYFCLKSLLKYDKSITPAPNFKGLFLKVQGIIVLRYKDNSITPTVVLYK